MSGDPQVTWDAPGQQQAPPQIKWDDDKTPPKQEEPGFLDKEIPLSGSLLNPTLSGIQSVGRGFRNAYRGIADTLDPNMHEGEEGIGSNAVPGVIARPIARIGKGLYDTAKEIPEIPRAIHDINASPDPLSHYAKAAQDTAGEGAAQALTAAATEGAGRIAGRIGEAIPRDVAGAPVRAVARGAEGVVNSSPLRYVRSAGRLFTPADEARKMIRIPGRDFGLDLPSNPGAPLPERPLPAVMQARGLQTGGHVVEEPSTALARIPTPKAEPDTALALNPKGKIGGRLVLTPEEIQQSERIQQIAAKRASERGMQYAGGMKPSGGKIAAP